MNTADELLLRLVDADAKIRPDRQSFYVWWTLAAPKPAIGHPGLGSNLDWAAQDIEDLADAGYLRVSRGDRDSIDGFDVTQSGFEHARRLRRAEASSAEAEPGSEHALTWETRVLPVLEAVGRAYRNAQPEIGVSLQMDPEKLRALQPVRPIRQIIKTLDLRAIKKNRLHTLLLLHAQRGTLVGGDHE